MRIHLTRSHLKREPRRGRSFCWCIITLSCAYRDPLLCTASKDQVSCQKVTGCQELIAIRGSARMFLKLYCQVYPPWPVLLLFVVVKICLKDVRCNRVITIWGHEEISYIYSVAICSNTFTKITLRGSLKINWFGDGFSICIETGRLIIPPQIILVQPWGLYLTGSSTSLLFFYLMKRQNYVINCFDLLETPFKLLINWNASPNMTDVHDEDMIFFQSIKSITCQVRFSD